MRVSAEAHRGACLPRADCPLAPAARASASLLCCFVELNFAPLVDYLGGQIELLFN
jgi:hypothetical protein